jgi:hypothetical protein
MTHDIKLCRLTADAVALIYHWWSLFVRLANPNARLEAITSRPFLLSGVARKIEHAGQRHLKITPLHGNNSKARDMLTRVSALMHDWERTAEGLRSSSILTPSGSAYARPSLLPSPASTGWQRVRTSNSYRLESGNRRI